MPRDYWAEDRAKSIGQREARRKQGRRWKPVNTPEKRQPPYKIPEGTEVSICDECDTMRKWKRHVMRKTLQFCNEHKTETCRGSSGAIIFRFKGYLILTRRATVKADKPPA